MDKKVEKFKIDYADIKKKVDDFKKKMRELKKEIAPTCKAAYRLYNRGDKTMYDENKGIQVGISPKFKGLFRMMEDLECWMDLDKMVQHLVDGTL